MPSHGRYLFFILFALLFPLLASALANQHESNFLVISDIHLDALTPHSMQIAPNSDDVLNDLDLTTFKKLISELTQQISAKTVAKPQFIIVLGDISGHLRIVPESVQKNEALVFQILTSNFPHTPIFYTFGNNDSLVSNYGPFLSLTQTLANQSPYTIAKSQAGWKNGFLSTGILCKKNKNTYPCLLDENIQQGYYSAYVKSQFQLISLNTNLFSSKRSESSENAALKQLHWLEQQLQAAKTRHESVLIALHIPPGSNVYNNSKFWLPEEQNQFLKLIKAYQKTIVGILAGHTHAEEIKLIKENPNKIIAGVYYTAALSTSHGNAPSVKTFYFDKPKNRWQLSDYATFYFSIHNNKLTLSPLYSYQQYYCSASQNTLSQCLQNVSRTKMEHYFTAGNKNYAGVINYPGDMELLL